MGIISHSLFYQTNASRTAMKALDTFRSTSSVQFVTMRDLTCIVEQHIYLG